MFVFFGFCIVFAAAWQAWGLAPAFCISATLWLLTLKKGEMV